MSEENMIYKWSFPCVKVMKEITKEKVNRFGYMKL